MSAATKLVQLTTGFTMQVEGYQPVNMAAVRIAVDMWTSNPIVAGAAYLIQSTLLGGSVFFSRKNQVLTDLAARWYGRVWAEFIADLLKALYTAGFAVTRKKPNKLYTAEPCVIAFDRLSVYHKKDEWGKDEYKVMEQDATFGVQKELKDVIVYTWDEPDAKGELTSVVGRISKHREYIETLRGCDMKASSKQSEGLIVTDPRDPSQWTLDQVTSSADIIDSESKLNIINHMTAPFQAAAQAQSYDYMERCLSFIRTMGMDEFKRSQFRFQQAAMESMIRRQKEAHDVRDGRTFRHHAPAQSPPHIIQAQLLDIELCCMQFGIPPAVFLSRGSGATRAQVDLNARITWENTQADVRKEILLILHDMWDNIYLEGDTLAFIAQSAAEQKEPNAQDFSDAIDITIQLPGQPPTDEMKWMWEHGFLSEEYAKQYFASRFALDQKRMAKPISPMDILTTGKWSMQKREIESAQKLQQDQLKAAEKTQHTQLSAAQDMAKLQSKLDIQTAAATAPPAASSSAKSKSKKRKRGS